MPIYQYNILDFTKNIPWPPRFRNALARDCAVAPTSCQLSLSSILARRSPSSRAALNPWLVSGKTLIFVKELFKMQNLDVARKIRAAAVSKRDVYRNR